MRFNVKFEITVEAEDADEALDRAMAAMNDQTVEKGVYIDRWDSEAGYDRSQSFSIGGITRNRY